MVRRGSFHFEMPVVQVRAASFMEGTTRNLNQCKQESTTHIGQQKHTTTTKHTPTETQEQHAKCEQIHQNPKKQNQIYYPIA